VRVVPLTQPTLDISLCHCIMIVRKTGVEEPDMADHTDYKYRKTPPMTPEESDKEFGYLDKKYGKLFDWLAGNGSPEDEKKN